MRPVQSNVPYLPCFVPANGQHRVPWCKYEMHPLAGDVKGMLEQAIEANNVIMSAY